MAYRPKDIYRGRRKFRVPLTIGLSVLAILLVGTVAMFYFLQRFLVYDQTGVSLQLPFMASEAEEEPAEAEPTPAFVPVEVEVVYEDPDFSELDLGGWEALSPVKAKFIPFSAAADEVKLEAAVSALSGDYTGVVLEVKDRSGQLAWASGCDMAVAYGTAGLMDYTETVAALHERGLTASAQLSCLADELIATRNWTVVLRDLAGNSYRDGDGAYWLDPYNRTVRDYIEALMTELAAMGFDEIILADLYHPVSDSAVYESPEDGEEGEDVLVSTGFQYSVTIQTTADPVNAICQMARRLVEGMEGSETTVSALIDEDSLREGNAARTGQDLDIFWRIFARLYCPCESWNAMADLETAAETLNDGDIASRFVPVCEYIPENIDSYLILPTAEG